MGSDVVRNLLLGLIAAALLVGGCVYLDQHREHSPAWRSEYAAQKDDAELYCTLAGVVPGGADSLKDPAYLRCVRDEAMRRMRSWEGQHPHEVWGGLLSGL